jgi:hypothetical protein
MQNRGGDASAQQTQAKQQTATDAGGSGQVGNFGKGKFRVRGPGGVVLAQPEHALGIFQHQLAAGFAVGAEEIADDNLLARLERYHEVRAILRGRGNLLWPIGQFHHAVLGQRDRSRAGRYGRHVTAGFSHYFNCVVSHETAP